MCTSMDRMPKMRTYTGALEYFEKPSSNAIVHPRVQQPTCSTSGS